jgi:2-C-methyl-D-erythritol 4-phosphate cytidylyltransferase
VTVPDPRTAVVLVAAGSGTRVGSPTNKVLLPLLGTPVLAWSLHTLSDLVYVDRFVVVVRREDAEVVEHLVEQHRRADQEVLIVEGGATRHDSEWRGLRSLSTAVDAGEVDVIAVHDAARPLVGRDLFDATIHAAKEHGGAVPARPQPGLVSADGGSHVRGLVAVQTPQAFRAGPLLDAYARASQDGFVATDTAGCFATYTDLVVHAVPAPATNLKITFPEDLEVAEQLLTAR